MEKAILKTLIYSDIFDYPLKGYEIHKWLIGKRISLRQVEKALGKLCQVSSVKCQNHYYFLPKRVGLVDRRKRRERQSESYLRKARILVSLLKIIPWIKLVGISGGLSMGNASKSDDIDLFIIISRNRLWISRLFILGTLSLLGQRRKVTDMGQKIAGKLCINTLLEEDRLEQSNKDIYLAHEVLQMKVLWQREGVYGKYLEANNWAFKFLPNWVGSSSSMSFPRKLASRSGRESNKQKIIYGSPYRQIRSIRSGMTMLENLAKWFQLRLMSKPKGMERIQDGALYFHPNDIRPKILKLYQQKISRT